MKELQMVNLQGFQKIRIPILKTMVKTVKLLVFTLLFFAFVSASMAPLAQNVESEKIQIQKVSDHVYLHTSFLDSETFGKVACNGMIVFDKKEAIIFNTPTDNAGAVELINWVENTLGCKIKAVIPTHFHADCLGGLTAFHQRGITSYANNATIQITKAKNLAVPQKGFDQVLDLKVGSKKVKAEFLGEGHTKDNIIGYFPDEKIMFGGCLIKETGAGKGNLEDATISEWSNTVTKLKTKYPDAKLVIPGHGKSGGTDLLDYTIKMFQQ